MTNVAITARQRRFVQEWLWMLIAFSSINDYRIDPKTGDIVLNSGAVIPDAVRVVKKRKVKFGPGCGRNKGKQMLREAEIELWSKEKALEILSKHLGIIGDRLATRLSQLSNVAGIPPPVAGVPGPADGNGPNAVPEPPE